ncbi:MAG: hypothetical protein AVDCRST_MAG36-1551, partial [uncultured Nocardioidaceae bacterium]
ESARSLLRHGPRRTGGRRAAALAVAVAHPGAAAGPRPRAAVAAAGGPLLPARPARRRLRGSVVRPRPRPPGVPPPRPRPAGAGGRPRRAAGHRAGRRGPAARARRPVAVLARQEAEAGPTGPV